MPKTQTLAALKEQRDRLDAEIARIEHQHIPGVIAKMKAAIDHYGITHEQLFNGQAKVVKTRKGPLKAKPAAKKKAVKAVQKYRDPETGESWPGRGPHPQWLKQRLAQGKTLEDYKA